MLDKGAGLTAKVILLHATRSTGALIEVVRRSSSPVGDSNPCCGSSSIPERALGQPGKMPGYGSRAATVEVSGAPIYITVEMLLQ